MVIGFLLLLSFAVVGALYWYKRALFLQKLYKELDLRRLHLEDEKALLEKDLQNETFSKKLLEQELLHEKSNLERTKELVEHTKTYLLERFKTVTQESFVSSQSQFFAIAKETFDQYQVRMALSLEKQKTEMSGVVSPLKNSLSEMEKKVFELEVSRKGAYESLKQELLQLSSTQVLLQKETSNLVKALREPATRGRWGEVQLRRTVEVAGMLAFCDFEEQVHVATEDGALRPDMIVKLPQDRIIVIDAKVSLSAYLDAIGLEDPDEREEKLVQHGKQVRQHVSRLAQKKYWEQFPKAPDFVVLFLHGDCFLMAALEREKDLLEYASSQKVLIATPTSLIAMLKIIAFSWGEAKIEQNAQAVLQEARTLLERCTVFADHFREVGRQLDRSSKAYQRAASSFESRLLVSLRKLANQGIIQASDLPPPILFDTVSEQEPVESEKA